MLLIVHILIALAGLLFTAFTYITPSSLKLRLSNILVGLTVASGTILVIERSAPLVQSCVTGLIYLGVAYFGILAAHKKLATAKARNLNQ